jgi:hypothetical protein
VSVFSRAARSASPCTVAFPGSPSFTRRALAGYGELTLLQARQKAREWLKLIERGLDPQDHEEQQRRAQERERQNTFAAVAEDFIRSKLSGERKGREVERDIRREFLPIWGKRPVAQSPPAIFAT